MHLLFLISHLRKGGLVNVVYNLCTQLLTKSNIKIYIVTLRQEGQDSLFEKFKKLGIDIFQLKSSFIECEMNTIKLTKKMQQIVDDNHIDIVHCHGYHPVIVGSGLHRVKKVSTLHDRANEDFINVFGNIIGKYMLFRYLRSLRKFDISVAVSESAALLYKQLGLQNVTFVNNGIDTDFYMPIDSDTIMKLRKKYSLPLKNIIFISTGRIEKEKRYVEMINTFKHLVKNNEITLVILGDGSQLKKCKETAEDNTNIIFTGMVKEVKDYLQCSDFYVSNSISEGMSMAVCEAISCGLNPILSNIPSHKDIASALCDEKLAYIYDNIDTLTVDQLPIVYNKFKLHTYIESNFSLYTMGKGYLNIYNNL